MVITIIAIPALLLTVLAGISWLFNELYNSRFKKINSALDGLYEICEELDVEVQKLQCLLEEVRVEEVLVDTEDGTLRTLRSAPTPKKKTTTKKRQNKKRNYPSPNFSGQEFNVQMGRKKK